MRVAVQKLSVRKIIEFVLRSGDIDSRFGDSSAVYLGAAAHRKIQGQAGDNYAKEVSLKHKTSIGDIPVVIQGRADGIISEDNGVVVIDEIKSTTQPLDFFYRHHEEHLAQGKCYAYMYMKCLEDPPDSIVVQLTYFQLETEELRKHRWVFSAAELEAFFLDLLEKYGVWLRLELEWKLVRDESIGALEFPFATYRKGQRELAIASYRAISAGKKLYASAPTGIGKTISALFPSVKALGEGKCERVFYLTAKSLTRSVAQEALALMVQKGLRLRSVTLRAKEKLCPNVERVCTPVHCRFAKGHYDRVNDALYALVSEIDLITPDKVAEYALSHAVCPHELSLDASLWCDVVIGDYNHLFDPGAYLRRFFENQKAEYVFLIDEAHNLADRVRDMYSSAVRKSVVARVMKGVKGRSAGARGLRKTLRGLVSYLGSLGENRGRSSAQAEQDLILKELMEEASEAAEAWLLGRDEVGASSEDRDAGAEVLEFYFEISGFLFLSQIYDECFTSLTEITGKDVAVTLFCLDPSRVIASGLDRGKSSILFSATLTPLNYYCEILGGSEDDFILSLTSPFDPSRLTTVSHVGISTKYAHRAESYEPIARAIAEAVSACKGNYLVFFPSYEYLRQVFECFTAVAPNVKSLVQQSEMTEGEREDFLKCFCEGNPETLVGFTVLGGVFSEGIDLKGDRLVGAVIVSVGIPMISFKRDLIRDYFQKKNGQGYDYAYVFPGMNKVLQAAGRVIRTETDSGLVLLIDSRYDEPKYRGLFPAHWEDMRFIHNIGDLHVVS